MITKPPKGFYENFTHFFNGAMEALEKVGNVSYSKGTTNMRDKGWQLTKNAEGNFRQECINWFNDNYYLLFDTTLHGQTWSQLGCWFICTTLGTGTGFWDMHTGQKQHRETLTSLGKRLTEAVKDCYGHNNEVFDMYIVKGKYCNFSWTVPTKPNLT